jgi:hypothetical protein
MPVRSRQEPRVPGATVDVAGGREVGGREIGRARVGGAVEAGLFQRAWAAALAIAVSSSGDTAAVRLLPSTGRSILMCYH